jgi:hypothetical protein
MERSLIEVVLAQRGPSACVCSEVTESVYSETGGHFT